MACGGCKKIKRIRKKVDKEFLEKAREERRNKQNIKNEIPQKKVVKNISWKKRIQSTIERIESNGEDKSIVEKITKALLDHEPTNDDVVVINIGTDNSPKLRGIFIN